MVQADQPVKVELPNQGKTFTASVSTTLPQFDNVTRTLKLRLEVDNLDFTLKPDMFVDVELPLSLAEAVVVPAEAVLDAGLRQTVFVDRGNGYFEPRNVHLGSRVGDQVQVVQGLTPGERIVVSGNFLLDSESRMKLAATGVHGMPLSDPVCGMTVDEGKAKAAKRVIEYQGQTYGFCSDGCKKKFEADPAKYLDKAKGKPAAMPMTMAMADPKEATNPVCGMKVEVAEAKAAKLTSEHEGMMYFFCSDHCKKQFDVSPAKHVAQAKPPAMTMAMAEPTEATDPVCGMKVDVAEAKAAKLTSEHQGKTYFFCSDHCKKQFDAGPAKYLAAGQEPGGTR